MENYTAEQIKEQRKKLGLTQSQLAEMVGVSNKAISKWETGEGLPDIENIKRLASLFHMSIDQLLEAPIHPKSNYNPVTIGFAIATLIIFFLPFLKLSLTFIDSNHLFISNNGYQLMGQILKNGQLGNFIISFSLFIILASNIAFAFPQIASFGKPFIQRLSLVSAIGSILTVLFLFLSKSTMPEFGKMSFQIGPFVLCIMQCAYFFYLKKQDFNIA